MLPTKFHFIWLRGFRRLKWEKLTDDGRQVMAKAHIAFGKWAKKKHWNFLKLNLWRLWVCELHILRLVSYQSQQKNCKF